MVIELKGKWKKGYAIDKHTLHSTYVGDNEYGYKIFDTKRSEIGELVYQLKYQGKKNIINDIMVLVKPILDDWQIGVKIDIIMPIPPSNISRTSQPVFIIAQAISDYLKIPMKTQVLKKTKHEQLKNASINEKSDLIKGSITKDKNFKKKVNILLIDDLFESGATLNEAVDVLKSDINVADVYVLTMTKTGRR